MGGGGSRRAIGDGRPWRGRPDVGGIPRIPGRLRPPGVAALIVQLGAEDYAARQAAHTALLEQGLDALPHLRAAERSADPEDAMRVQGLAREITDIPPARRPALRDQAQQCGSIRPGNSPARTNNSTRGAWAC